MINIPIDLNRKTNPMKFIKEPNFRQMALINADKGRHWFEPDTMRFFKTRLCGNALPGNNGNMFFVSSERGPNKVRAYSVREFEVNTGTVNTVGKFQEFDTLYQANKRLNELCR